MQSNHNVHCDHLPFQELRNGSPTSSCVYRENMVTQKESYNIHLVQTLQLCKNENMKFLGTNVQTHLMYLIMKLKPTKQYSLHTGNTNAVSSFFCRYIQIKINMKSISWHYPKLVYFRTQIIYLMLFL
jgi:hypothetical protein